jgi:tetratricopeptide (TPR) repeat protein
MHIDEARAQLKRLRDCRGLSPVEIFTLGLFFGKTHDFREALRLFQSLAPNIPDPPRHQYAVALAQFELADYQAAIETLSPGSAKTSLPEQSVNLLAVAYSKLGRYQDAYEVLTGELKNNRSDRLAYLNLITLLSDTGNTPAASEIADQAVSTFPHDSELLVVRGATLGLLGKTQKACNDFVSAIKISPRDPSPRFLLAVTDYKQGDYQAAETELIEAIKSGIRDSDLHYLLAECLLRIDGRNINSAMLQLNRALVLNGKSVSALSLRGKLLLESHRTKEALADLELAHRLDPRSRAATYGLARAYFGVGRRTEAEALTKSLTSSSIDNVEELGDQRLRRTVSGATVP